VCAACGVPTHVPVLEPEPAAPQPAAGPGQSPARPAKFAALRNPACPAVARRSPFLPGGSA
jgi:hypothetical protein